MHCDVKFENISVSRQQPIYFMELNCVQQTIPAEKIQQEGILSAIITSNDCELIAELAVDRTCATGVWEHQNPPLSLNRLLTARQVWAQLSDFAGHS